MINDILNNKPENADLKQWKNNACTLYFKAVLNELRDDIKENIVRGTYTGDTTDKTAQLLAKAIGIAENLEDVMYSIESAGEDEKEIEEN